MLGALFYPKGTQEESVKFDELFIPYIYKEIYLEGVYVDMFNVMDGWTVMDVGANIGITAQYFRDKAKIVYALEPSTEHFEALSKNIEFNNWTNVKAFNVALADKNGEMTLNSNKGNRTCHSLTLDFRQGGEKVKTVAFDTFMEENKIDQIDFCKFDTEGAEDLILRSESFKKVAPKIKHIMVEMHHSTYPELVKYMMELGYEARRYVSSAVVVLFVKK
jgi:FkbM family methyltransferase